MRALLNLALPVIVWINPALIIRLMVNVLRKIVLLTPHQLVQVPWLVKPLVAATVNNAVPIVVHPVLKIIPVLMPQLPNAAISVFIAIHLALLVLPLLIPALSVLITNAV